MSGVCRHEYGEGKRGYPYCPITSSNFLRRVLPRFHGRFKKALSFQSCLATRRRSMDYGTVRSGNLRTGHSSLLGLFNLHRV